MFDVKTINLESLSKRLYTSTPIPCDVGFIREKWSEANLLIKIVE